MADVFQSGAASIRVDSHQVATSGVDPVRFAGFGGLSSLDRNWRLRADGAVFETSSVWRVSTSPGTATKTPGIDADTLIVGIVTQGRVDAQIPSGASLRFLPGECFHITSAATCNLTWTVPTRFILIVASTAVLEEYGAVIDGECNRIDADTDLLRPIASFSETLVEHHAIDMNLTKFLLERLLQEQLGAILLSSASYAEPELSPRHTVYRQSKAIIKAKHADYGFAPATLAHDTGVSLRLLQKIFAHHGETVAGEIRNARARHAQSLLRDSRYATLTKDQIARYAGFSSAHVMRRAFKDLPPEA
ncbi:MULTISPECIES: helix-turn-helix transcriptional regulator [unclassified Pseudoclavibacter]|uniref:helix-turn-helix transcriptional regulator n=1 Tax=unclassified Pseudoclavibacter TaxID=2615177 RepID=UPI001BA457B4|nr:helix-turn-helix domain-containing protein [Pseudoclavibacter sp. Marseille-Q4354]MBS3177251.1 helix-turn-helix domain-containing protein [Pseudoclavibacter sp. Marseille-Q4354]